MNISAFGIVGLIVAAVFFALASNTAGASRIQAMLQNLSPEARFEFFAAKKEYMEHVQPEIRRFGFVAMAFLLFTVIAVFGFVPSDSANEWVGRLRLSVPLLASAGIIVIYITMRWNYSSLRMASAIVAATAATGIVLFVCGIGMNNLGIAMMGAGFILAAKAVLFFVATVVAALLAEGVKIAEGSTNLLLKLVIGILSKKSFEQIIGTGGVNLSNEERYVPLVRAARRRVDLAIHPILAIGLLTLSFMWLGAICFAAIVGYLILSSLSAGGIDTTSRRERSLLVLESLSYILLTVAVAKMFIPSIGEAFGERSETLKDGTVGLVRGESVAIPSWKTGLIALLIGGAVFWVAFPWNDDAKISGVRKLIAYPFGALAVIGLLGVTGSLLYRNSGADAISLDGSRKSAMSAPVVTRVGKDLLFKWDAVPGAVDYKIEYRTDEMKEPLSLTNGGFAKGVTRWQGTLTMAPGVEYRFRMVAVYKKAGKSGEVLSEPSPEVAITVPRTGVAANASASAPVIPSIGPAKSRPPSSACTSDGCKLKKDGSALAELRREAAEENDD